MGMNRRGFIKIVAGLGAGATAGALVTPIPWKLLDDVSIWSQNWPWLPSLEYGENTYVSAMSKTCPSAVALKVRLVNGRPVRVLPNDDHPLGGGVTALAVNELQMLHSPARVHKPMLRGQDGTYSEIEWSKAAELLHDKVKEAQGKTAIISGDENGSVNDVLSAFAHALGSNDVYLMPSEGQAAARACDLMDMDAQLGYDLENSDYVLAIGANILETWGTVVRNRRIFGKAHPHPEKGAAPTASLVYAGPVQNNTAAVARPWLPIYPGTEAALALGIAAQLIAKGKTVQSSDFEAFSAFAAKYTPEETAKITGVSPEALAAVVDGLLKSKAPLVIAGGEFNQGGGAAPVLAGFAVNALLGNINAKGGVQLLPEAASLLSGSLPRRVLYKNNLFDFISKKEKPSVLIVHEANPVFALPDPEGVKASLKEIPFKATFASFFDETAKECDLVLPIPMGLERVDDIISPYGCGKTIYCATLPVAQPGADTRSTANTLLFIAKQMGFDLGVDMYENLIKSKASLMQGDYNLLMKGIPTVNDATVTLPFSLRPDVLEKTVTAASADEKLRLAVFSKLSLGTAVTGIPPFNVKTIRTADLDKKEMSVLMNSSTAQKAGLSQGQLVKLSAGKESILARLRIFEGVMTDTVAVCLGFGHTALDAFSQNKGANVMEILSASSEPETGLSVWSQARVDVSKA